VQAPRRRAPEAFLPLLQQTNLPCVWQFRARRRQAQFESRWDVGVLPLGVGCSVRWVRWGAVGCWPVGGRQRGGLPSALGYVIATCAVVPGCCPAALATGRGSAHDL
jgi:hypothetical protein